MAEVVSGVRGTAGVMKRSEKGEGDEERENTSGAGAVGGRRVKGGAGGCD